MIITIDFNHQLWINITLKILTRRSQWNKWISNRSSERLPSWLHSHGQQIIVYPGASGPVGHRNWSKIEFLRFLRRLCAISEFVWGLAEGFVFKLVQLQDQKLESELILITSSSFGVRIRHITNQSGANRTSESNGKTWSKWFSLYQNIQI